ncbi:ParB N-terminal domain-containing protein [Pseudofrankia sp. DC12]|uniref:ParB N-terminal domain-containing protein n=1 Tax=Pseudofrankia sp. DC12 TaxID=683315 RepID=UPI000698DCCA|nr:ParB N-terminal domain-containing protein [Pseudofrankia sp. DC12]
MGRINRDHVEALAHTGGDWPPILVRREDHTIVDGFYRYLAARQLGYGEMDCVYFDGRSEEAFLEAVRRNLRHGLPLSLREREAAAHQALAFHPDWSDRRLGEACGLAPGTVGRLRDANGCAPEQNGQLNVRLGRDGKRYPVDPDASRERIIRLLREEPDRSLRSVAQATGTSPSTVRAVKMGLARPAAAPPPVALVKSPAVAVPPRSRTGDPAAFPAAEVATFTRWFERTDVTDEWRELVPSVPAAKVREVLDEARRRARSWLEFASALEAEMHPGEVRVGA